MDTIDCPRCENEHQACGIHEEDATTWECDECGFMFECEVEYDPSYSTTCITHEFGEYEKKTDRNGEEVDCRFCKHCMKCEIREDTTA